MGTVEKLRFVRLCNASRSSFFHASRLLDRIDNGASERIARTFLAEWEKEYPEYAQYIIY